jgi:predicted phosphodiesterase
MTQAIASDIHGNIERLEQFARVVDSLGIPPQEVYILGDIIHNGADLKENRCVDLI